MTDEEKIAKLEAIYERIPKMKTCVGKCEDSCTVVPTTPFEKARIEKAMGKKFESIDFGDGRTRCSALKNEKCSQYELRPLLCRLFGTSKHPFLKCEYGCEPERWLHGEEVFEFLIEVQELCGDMDNPKNPYLEPLTEEQKIAAGMLFMR